MSLKRPFPSNRTQSIVEGGMQREDCVESEEPDRPARNDPVGDDRESYGHRIGCLLGRDQNAHPDGGEKSHIGEVDDECSRGSFQRLADRAAELRCGGCEPSKAAESGLLRPIMSPFSTATIREIGTTGCAA